jgi:glycosyltransferase involved in cell wall biosynthesis
MKVALVHELLTMRGGAEGVLRILAHMYPDAPIYTLLYDEKKLGDWFPKERVHVGIRNPLSFNHHLYLKQFPAIVEAWDFSEFDLVISSSSAFVHGMITNGKPKHLCYVHSPARYLWDRAHDVLDRTAKGPLGFFKRLYLQSTFHTLRQWDAEVAPRADVLIAASKEVERRIQLYWDRSSDVIYPPINDHWLQERTPINNQMEHGDYFLIVSTLASYKRIDLAIDACNKLGVHLKIVGEGAELASLKKRAGPTIHFYGYRQGDELVDLVAGAKATIIPGEEDFGLVALESMAVGTPVIGYGKGGITETVIPGETGVFFMEETAASLMQVLQDFDPKKYSRQTCRERAKLYSETAFVQKIRSTINVLLLGAA